MAKVHLMRLAVQDLRTSHVRKRAKRLGRPELWLLYLELLWALYEAGGELSSDPEVLADEVEFFTPDQIRELLPLLAPGDGKRGGIVVEGDRIRNLRLTDEVAQEAAFSRQQAIRGRRGGRAKARAEYEVKADRKASKRQAIAKPSVAVAVSPSSPSSTYGETAALAPSIPNHEREEYMRQVWAAWCVKRGGDLPEPSSNDLDLARALFDDGVPLRVALRGIEDCSKPPRGRMTPLVYCNGAFNDAARHWRKSQTA